MRRDGGGDLARVPGPTPAAPQFTPPSLPSPETIPPEAVAEIRRMPAQNQKIKAIKRLRELTGCGLAEAKDRLERLWIEPSLILYGQCLRWNSRGAVKMKAMIIGIAGLGVGGAYYMTDSPDFDRVVKKSPTEVFAAFSRLAQEGIVTPPGQTGPGPRISFRVEKVTGQSIHYEIQFDQRPVVEADLTFAPAGEDGRQTRMTAELEIDAFELGSAFRTEAGVALSMVPNRLIDTQFANFMDDMVRDIEAGRPLPSLASRGMEGMGVRSARVATDPDAIRRQTARAQRAASRPQQSAGPMVDPNEAANRYRNGGPRDGGWSR